jgi:hypothetical protein
VLLSLDCYVEEIPDYGVDAFVQQWADAGVERLRPTIMYHPARIFSPANPLRRLLDLEGDVCFLGEEMADCFEGSMRPVFTKRSAGVLGQVAESCRALGLGMDGWLVALNNWALATKHPDFAVQSALGGPDRTWLSPSHPETREYIVGAIRAVGQSGLVDRLLQVESLYHVPFPCHPCDRVGIGINLGPLDLWLAGVCISEQSKSLISECGGDGDRVAAALRRHFDSKVIRNAPSGPATPESIAEILKDDTEAVLRGRELAVERLISAAAQEAGRYGLQLEFEDDLASWESFFSGVMSGPLSGERQWELGTRRSEIFSIVDHYLLLLYVADRDRIEAEILSCIEALGRAPHVGIRPYPPDVRSTSDLEDKLALIEQLGVDEVMLYMQSLMPKNTPTIVRDALASVRSAP